ncbi:4-hydroxyphenylacetate 3-monooxygenase, oxygenase component [Virgibacillus ndiopensis]|uniref:4-hydroxyphenylacetate 3-monooxygenase, oxygenase component n=1 Tax=Virgibacillus ndiopensis TaxID=2004408 RepID=UPI000C073C90|nr:4-hydroxyphenylacetate 3-monooxygenase, oxygenase component [Virgibacillus ndiopensis]
MPIISGEDYMNRINKLKSDIWIEGKRIEGKISEHKAFKGVMKSQAALYDLQHTKSIEDIMTYDSPSSGEKVGTSYLIPKTKEDLLKRRKMIQEWAKVNGGLMGRSPDYMNTILASFAASVDLLKGEKNCFPENLLSFYEYARENDLSFTHTFINPQVNRGKFYFEDDEEDEIITAQVVEKNKDGIIIKGARLLATQGGITDEILVFSTVGADEAHSYAFSIPSNTKGLRFICRESFVYKDSEFDHPLSSRFEEMDTVIVFNDVLVPWDRVFYYDNPRITGKFFTESLFFPLTLHQIVARQVTKTEFVLGIVQSLVDTINIGEYQHVQDKVSEIILARETMKAFLIASEHQAKQDVNGTMVPDLNTLYAAINTFPKIYPRFSEIIQSLGASGLVSIPTEKDFKSEIKGELDLYLRAATKKAEDRVKLFRLAWDLSMSAFGTRQTLYERFFFGDPIRLSQSLYMNYKKDKYVENVHRFLNMES